jgi:hypothetical protein
MKRANFDLGEPWFSSYEKNNYGDLFYSLIRIYRPKTVIELGTKAGYSAYHIARGLKKNRTGKLYCYDLWEKYPFRSVPKAKAEKNLKRYKDIVRFKSTDATKVYKLHRKVDILHVDLSNEGEILNNVIPHWISRVNQLIIIEGGSIERDKLDWMIKFNKKSIREWLKKFSLKHKNIRHFTIGPFPSVTIIRKSN